MCNPIEKCQKSRCVAEKLVVVGQFFNGVLNHFLMRRYIRKEAGGVVIWVNLL
jgi:hypothetical protein